VVSRLLIGHADTCCGEIACIKGLQGGQGYPLAQPEVVSSGSVGPVAPRVCHTARAIRARPDQVGSVPPADRRQELPA
jgi:hypothetical protein